MAAYNQILELTAAVLILTASRVISFRADPKCRYSFACQIAVSRGDVNP